MDGVTVINHPLVQHKLTIMRKKETSTAGFRRLLREISTLLCYEVTRDLELTMETIETPMQALVRLTVRKDLRVTGPEFLAAPDPHAALRNGARYATDGIGPDLMTAARDALRRMIEWLGREHGLDAMRAYLLCSVAVDLRISEIVDVPNFVVTAHCPLGIFD